MLASEVIKRYEAYCPQELSMEGDVRGLQVRHATKRHPQGHGGLRYPRADSGRSYRPWGGLDHRQARAHFRPIKDLVADRAQNQIYIDLIKHDIAVYVSHTNIDIVPDGLNDWFCQLLDIEDTEPLSITGEELGIGRIGQLSAQTFGQLAEKVKETFGLDALRLVSYDQTDLDRVVARVAICGGSGQSFYKDALAKGAEVYITGDIYYHTAQDMLSDGLLALDPGHHIEVLFVSKLVEKLNQWKAEEAWEIEVIGSQASTNPFYHI